MPTLSVLNGSRPHFWPALQAAAAGALPGSIPEGPGGFAPPTSPRSFAQAIGAPAPADRRAIGAAYGSPEGPTLGGAFGSGGALPAPGVNAMRGIERSLIDNSLSARPEKKFLGLKSKEWAAMLAAAADSIRAHQGTQSNVLGGLMQSWDREADRDLTREELNAKLAAEREDRLRPKLEQVGNTIGMLDPSALVFNPIFTAPQPWELYAKSLGHEPGSEGFRQAIEDYRAGTWGDEGVAGRLAVQQPRLDVSRENNIRSTSTSRDNNIRTTSMSRDNNIRSTTQSNANNVRTTATSRDNNIRSNETRLRTARRIRIAPNEPKAVGPNGEELVVRNGRWIDTRTGKPVR